MAEKNGFSIDENRLGRITRQVQAHIPSATDEQIRDYVLADWAEGEEHQKWLDNSNAMIIAGWVIEGLRNVTIECESCAESGEHGVPAVGHSTNPDWSGYDLCQECIDEYDQRAPINQAEKEETA